MDVSFFFRILNFLTYTMLIDAAIVYPMATPKRFAYCINPQIFTLSPPVDQNQASKIKQMQLNLIKAAL
jgi:hypothetical protein